MTKILPFALCQPWARERFSRVTYDEAGNAFCNVQDSLECISDEREEVAEDIHDGRDDEAEEIHNARDNALEDFNDGLKGMANT